MFDHSHLAGIPFELGRDDCYSLIRGFYKGFLDLDLPNYARPNNFWEHGLNLYTERYLKNGFRVLHCHPLDYQFGDLVLMSVRSKIVNHGGVLVENGGLLHHAFGRLSLVEPYRGLWRDCTMMVLRHKTATVDEVTPTIDVIQELPRNVRSKL